MEDVKERPARGGRRGWLLLAAALGGAALAYGLWRGDPPRPAAGDDPRLAYRGPYRNIHPDVKYVGDAACVACHVELAATFARHPMGRSLFPTPEVAKQQPSSATSRFEALGRRLWVSHEGGKTFHHVAAYVGGEKLYEQVMEAKYVIGSGTHGFSYLGEKDGHVFQTPISYFDVSKKWGISPGFNENTIHGRTVPGACLQCHAGGLVEKPGGADRFGPGVFSSHAIGCERCHGPGEPHVRERERGDPLEEGHDTATVNPRRLPIRERDGVCQQCHLQGKARVLKAGRGLMEFRPGLPWDEFMNVFVAPDGGEEGKTVGHFEEMRLSLCHQKTEGEGKLGCISCHDPHYKPAPADRVAFFRDRCARCHEGTGKKGCSVPAAERARRAPGDSCVDCHMPPRNAQDVAHAALNDHRVPRRPGDPSRRVPGAAAAEVDLRAFDADLHAADDPGQERDLGVAMAQQLGGAPPGAPGVREQASRVIPLLEKAAGRGPRDKDAWAALGQMRRLAGDREGAKDALTHALSLEPDDPLSLTTLALLHDSDPVEGAKYLRRAAAAYPTRFRLRASLAGALEAVGDTAGAEAEARAVVGLAPGNTDNRFLLCRVLAVQKKHDEARKELALLRKLRPPRLREIEAWAALHLGK